MKVARQEQSMVWASWLEFFSTPVAARRDGGLPSAAGTSKISKVGVPGERDTGATVRADELNLELRGGCFLLFLLQ